MEVVNQSCSTEIVGWMTTDEEWKALEHGKKRLNDSRHSIAGYRVGQSVPKL